MYLFLVIILIGSGCTNQDPSLSSTPESSIPTQEKQLLDDEAQEKDTEEAINDSSLETENTAVIVLEDEVEVLIEEVEEEEKAQEETKPSEEPLTEEEETSEVNIIMKSGNFFFEPNQISVSAGEEVHITFLENSGFHTFVIDEINLNESIETGTTISFTAPSDPGNYAYYCDVGSHRSMGMEGVLIVK